ncbi:SDR family NAD(P)-dependent oxidoreductase [Celeribacter sp.]|uniref:SDR family NAD(P)-dependent oxidoreductase n=1 Tax=Celeribacter sp. TaxID=1890673 RepID=UPI003A910EF9
MTFENKSVFISGAATGIGRATALAFASEGAKVLIADVDKRAADVVAEITGAGGVAQFAQCDVTDAAQVRAAVSKAVQDHGGLHAAFNNAGVLPKPEPMHEVTDAGFDRVMEVDLKGVFHCMQAQIAQFLTTGGGAIVNTASVAGLVADPMMSVYVAAKHAVVGLTKAAAIEYATCGIRVNAIAPGFVATPMTEAWLEDEDFREEMFKHNIIGRAADPAEISGTVLHLCSEAASFTNGTVHVVDGGQTAH